MNFTILVIILQSTYWNDYRSDMKLLNDSLLCCTGSAGWLFFYVYVNVYLNVIINLAAKREVIL